MSALLIAILAIFCCLVGFVMGRITASPISPSKLGSINVKLASLVAGIPGDDGDAFERARSEYIRRAIETGDTLDPSGTRLL